MSDPTTTSATIVIAGSGTAPKPRQEPPAPKDLQPKAKKAKGTEKQAGKGTGSAIEESASVGGAGGAKKGGKGARKSKKSSAEQLAKKLKQQLAQTKLDLAAPVFVPSAGLAPPQINAGGVPLVSEIIPTGGAVKQFNLDAPVFKPSKPASVSNGPHPAMNIFVPTSQQAQFTPVQPKPEQPQFSMGASYGQTYQPSNYPQSVLPSYVTSLSADPMLGYVNKFTSKPQVSAFGSAPPKLAEPEQEEQSRVYTIEFMLSLRAANRDRPPNMALMDFPHKKKRQINALTGGGKSQMTEADKFNFTVRELRILLNKLSKDNFETVSKRIVNDFQITPSLLNELMKIIFMKATTESTYLEIYVRLCILLFKKFNDKDNKEMNFKKLLLMKCQKQFCKLQAREEEDRRSRRLSLDSNQSKNSRQSQKSQRSQQSHSQQSEGDFNKQMLFVFDKEEIKFRQRLQLFGNMSLLVELYIQSQIPEGIIKTCVDSLLDDIHDQSAEIACQMMHKIAAHVVKKAQLEQSQPKAAGRRPLSQSLINLEYVESVLARIFPYRSSELSSRVRFKIQDLIDEYQRDWKQVIYGERHLVDEEGFHYKYVPKEQIQLDKKAAALRKGSAEPVGPSKAYIYVKKGESAIKDMLGGLKPEEPAQEPIVEKGEDPEEEQCRRLQGRKVSMNEQNCIGMDLERYNREAKPTHEVRRKIQNFVLEYQETKDRAHAQASLEEVCAETKIARFTFVGYVLHTAFSFDQSGWDDFLDLMLGHFYSSQNLLSASDLLEGVNVSLANFVDTLIDYPNARAYASDMLERLGALKVLSADLLGKYQQHVAELASYVEAEDEEA